MAGSTWNFESLQDLVQTNLPVCTLLFCGIKWEQQCFLYTYTALWIVELSGLEGTSGGPSCVKQGQLWHQAQFQG